jgi:hypothetical protein
MDEQQLLELCLHYHREGQKLSREEMSSGGQARDFYALLAAHIRLEQYHMSCELPRDTLSSLTAGGRVRF